MPQGPTLPSFLIEFGKFVFIRGLEIHIVVLMYQFNCERSSFYSHILGFRWTYPVLPWRSLAAYISEIIRYGKVKYWRNVESVNLFIKIVNRYPW